MEKNQISRRQILQGAALLGTALLIRADRLQAISQRIQGGIGYFG